ncbi:MAG TPA: DUF1828 domain-containing protein [bacterium]|nr:DUF1828 domain-containing protein [bacterium]
MPSIVDRLEPRPYLNLLKEQFNGHIELKEKRPGVMQLLVPLFHEDGDMVDIFLQQGQEPGLIRICDHAMTLMRLSYSFEIDTPNKERIFRQIVAENGIVEDNGNLFIETRPESLYPAILQFAQAVAKIANLEILRREIVRSLFYESLGEFIHDSLAHYPCQQKSYPIPDHDELEVDYEFAVDSRPIYLFGVKDEAKARLVTISCLRFEKARLPFRSMAVHENFEELNRKDRQRILSAVDKHFPTLDDFKKRAPLLFEREAGFRTQK